ncbi:MAR-binding filament-like protein 1-1 [Morella rubra]|uniref:MAR-binding filament-like protein 1-1 n=1 Tax=Morella rubra TaxID=262757 RepID=A0A6A1W4C4_9ROSI|nr:MAR-binding filament-like protein 1-1 [Morella rubra]
MAFMHHEGPNEDVHRKRRAMLFVGISVLPFLQLKARALEGLGTKESELKKPEENHKAKEEIEVDAPPNPLLFLLNGLGIFSSGLLGALYALAQREKTATNAAIESAIPSEATLLFIWFAAPLPPHLCPFQEIT